MPSVVSFNSALPDHIYSIQDVLKIGEEWLGGSPDQLQLFTRFVKSSGIEQRRFIMPSSGILSIGGMEERAKLFEQHAGDLGTEAARKCLNNSEIPHESLGALVFTSCSCPSIPSVDALIIDRLNLDRGILRVPIYQQGCAGGVVGLRLASELSKVRGPVLLVSVELCSLVFQRNNPVPAQLVGAAIFADGAASILIGPEECGLAFRASKSYLVPNTRHLMGYDILDDGPHLRLDRYLPQALINEAPEQVRSFLVSQGLKKEDISHWLFHPGGSKILDFLESTFMNDPSQISWARRVFTELGNLSSATILLVLKRFLDARICRPGDKVVMLGVGPGLTLEMILFEWVGE